LWNAHADLAGDSEGEWGAVSAATRRGFLQASGALIISFAMPPLAWPGQVSVDSAEQEIDAWLAISADGTVIAHCGKVELGTGVRTAFTQLIAEELDVPVGRVSMIMGDTDLCPDQGPTVGSASLLRGGPQVRLAAAAARASLLKSASDALQVGVEQLTVRSGVVKAPDGRKIAYEQLIHRGRFHRRIRGDAALKAPESFTHIGASEPRIELPAKILGNHDYIHNLHLPGMMHGRVIRPPNATAVATSVDEAPLRGLSDVCVLRKGGFVGVVAQHEEVAIRAARQLKVEWTFTRALPAMSQMVDALRQNPSDPVSLVNVGNVDAALAHAGSTLAAEYRVPHQMHASIGPSCAIADVRTDRATLWSPTQSSFLTRDSVAALLGMDAHRVRLIWTEGSGCYGHNGADDCTADAALLSQLAGQPVRVQWMRHDEHGNEPKGAAMVMAVRAGLDSKARIVAWDYAVWSPSHNGRPTPTGYNLLAGLQLGVTGTAFAFGAERNARCSYEFPNNRTTLHQLRSSPTLRVSSLRGLGSPQNTFANESFMDELAARAKADPIAYRINHLKDPRAIAVLTAVAGLARWDTRASPQTGGGSSGRGVAFVHYDNAGAYVAVIVHVQLDRASGQVHVPYVAVAHDCGLIVNPDGVRNQIEGNVIQALSRALLEEVQFDVNGVTSLDWNSYPILTFRDVPQEIAITLLNRPDQPMVGAGEATSAPIAAALANAIFDASGVRIRNVPFSAERLRGKFSRAGSVG
jgi:nicotinate dehydrogenase subunit B